MSCIVPQCNTILRSCLSLMAPKLARSTKRLSCFNREGELQSDEEDRMRPVTCKSQVTAFMDRDTHPISHVIIDMDGVIFDALPKVMLTHERYLGKWQKPLSKQFRHIVGGMRNIDAGEILTDEYELPFRKDVYAQGVWNLQRYLLPKAKIRKDVDDVIFHFAKLRIPIAFYSSFHEKGLRMILNNLKEFERHVCHIVHGDDVKRGKPDPEILIKCAQMFPSAPKELSKYLVIDSSHSGVLAAKKAGMQVTLITNEETYPPNLLKDANVAIHNIVQFDPSEFHLPAIKRKRIR